EPGLVYGDRPAHDLGERGGAADRRLLPRRDNRPGDAAGKSLLAERAYQVRECILREARNKLGGAGSGAAHPHSEGAGPARRTAPRRQRRTLAAGAFAHGRAMLREPRRVPQLEHRAEPDKRYLVPDARVLL